MKAQARPRRQPMKQCGDCDTWNEADKTRCIRCGAPILMAALTPRCTYEQAMDGTAQRLADLGAYLSTLTVEQWAQQAHRPGGPSVEELAERIRRRRAETARADRAAA